jgi:hypothetical protein
LSKKDQVYREREREQKLASRIYLDTHCMFTKNGGLS